MGTTRNLICLLLCVTLVLCCVSPVSAKEMDVDLVKKTPQNSDAEALDGHWYYYVDTDGESRVYRRSYAELPESATCTNQISVT